MLDDIGHAAAARARNASGPNKTEVLIGEARAGSTEALGQLMEGSRKYLLLMANQALDSDLRPKAAASDLVQDTFVEMQRDFADFRGTTEHELFSWLTAILANRLSSNVRRYRYTQRRAANREIPLELTPEAAFFDLGDGETPRDAAITSDEGQRLRRALDRVGEPHRTVLVLRAWERKTFVEIGETIGKSAESARKAWGRAVLLLKRELREV